MSVLVGWTDMSDFSARPIQLISGKTWKGSLFGGKQDQPMFLFIDLLESLCVYEKE